MRGTRITETPPSQRNTPVPQDRATDQSPVDLDISNLNWPKDLSQNQIVMMALAKLPDNQARQEVFDVVAKKLYNAALQKPVSFLRKVLIRAKVQDITYKGKLA